MNGLIQVKHDGDKQTTSARELWEFLDKPHGEFMKWFSRYSDYGFTKGSDYKVIDGLVENLMGGRPSTDYEITLDMAKELAMLQKSEKGKVARRYFLELERRWNSPEALIARALKMADKKLLEYQNQLIELLPKAEYFDALVDRNLLTSFRDTAKELHVKEQAFISWLKENKYIYKDAKKKWCPYAKHTPDLFQIKESVNGKWTGTQTLITPRGRETFRLLLGKELAKA